MLLVSDDVVILFDGDVVLLGEIVVSFDDMMVLIDTIVAALRSGAVLN